MENLKQQLLLGEQIFFTNEEFQERIGGDDVRIAKLEFVVDLPSWANGFKIWFNGSLIHSSKTFKSFEKKLNNLIEKWNLQQQFIH